MRPSHPLVALALLAAVLAVPAPVLACGSRYSERANIRACFANQKTLAGAVEMWNLDKNVRVADLDPGLLAALKAEGYLQSIPNDPGFGAGTSDRYVLLPEGLDGIACLAHGLIRGDQALSARAQLEARGVRDPALLARAGTTPVQYLHAPPLWRRVTVGLVELLVFVTMALFGMPFFVLPFPLALPLACGLLFLAARLVPVVLRGVASGVGRLLGLVPPPETSWTAPGVGAELAHARCPVCADGFTTSARLVACCPRCRTPHHEDCQQYLGGCGVFGCAPVSPDGLRAAAAERQAKSRAVQ